MLTALTPLSMGTASSTSTTVPLTDLTTGKIDGAGAFDTLMRSVTSHLAEQFTQNRITAREFATVYTELVPAVLAQSVQFLAAAKNIEKTNAEIALVRQQTVTELFKTDDAVPDGLGFNDSTSLEGLLKKDLTQKDADLALTEQKTVTELAQTGDIIPDGFGMNATSSILGVAGAQIGKTEGEISLLTEKTNTETNQTELIRVSADKVESETGLLNQKTATELAQTGDYLPTGVGLNTSTTIGGVVKGQVSKLTSEKDLLEQKTVTELAQTSEYLPLTLGHNTATTVSGTTQKNKELVAAQTAGFARDAEQRAAKIVVDTWTVRQSTDGEVTTNTGLDNTSVGEFIAKLKSGVNA